MPKDLELQVIKQLLDSAENSILEAKKILFSSEVLKKAQTLNSLDNGSIVEGVFDGEKMISGDKKEYLIPANYASKSKLVAGDILKLTITADGSFVYKQIGPIERKKLIGVLEESSEGKSIVSVGTVKFRILPASISYFKAQPGDKIAILVPEKEACEWAAVENVIK